MTELNKTGGDGEIGITNNSADASQQRFKLRQDYNKSAEGLVAGMQATVEKLNDADKEAKPVAPDFVEEKRILGIPVLRIQRWFKRG